MRLSKKSIVIWGIALCVSNALMGCTELTPSVDSVTSSLAKVLPIKFKVQSVAKVQSFPGLYEVIVTASNQPMVFYTDEKVRYVISGNLTEVGSRKNLTLESLTKSRRQN